MFNISELAKEVRLPSNFITEFLARAIQDQRLNALNDELALYTPQFVAAQRSLVYSTFAAISKPTPLQALVTRQNIYPGLFNKIIRVLLDEKKLPGHVDGDLSNGKFVPAAHDKSRLDVLHRCYVSNGYMAYSQLTASDVGNPKIFMTSRYNPPIEVSTKASRKQQKGKGKKADGLSAEVLAQYPNRGKALSGCFLSSALLANLACIEDVLQRRVPCCNVFGELPACVDPVLDCDAVIEWVLEDFPELEKDCISLSDGTFVHQAMFEGLSSQAEYVAREDFAGIAKKGAAAKVDPEDVPRNDRKLSLLLAKSLGWSINEKESLVQELYAHWEPHLRRIYAVVRDSLSAGSSSIAEARRLRKTNEEMIIRLYNQFRQFAKSQDFINQKFPTQSKSVEKQIVSCFAPRIMRGIFLDASLDYPDIFGKIAEECNNDFSLLSTSPLLTLNIKDLLDSFPTNVKEVLRTVLALSTGQMSGILDELHKLSSERSISAVLRPLGKKEDKQCFTDGVESMKAAVAAAAFEDSTEPAIVELNGNLFCNLVALILAQEHKILLHLSGKSVAEAIECIGSEDLKKQVQTAQALVTDALLKKTVVLAKTLNSLRDDVVKLFDAI